MSGRPTQAREGSNGLARTDRFAEERKADAIARFAAGIAHDYNNLLTAVIGFAEMAADRLDAESPAQADLRRIVEGADRAALLNRQLSAIGQRRIAAPTDVDLVELIEGCAHHLSSRPDDPAIVVRAAACSPHTVRGDPDHLRTAFGALLQFARSYPTPIVPLTVDIETLDLASPYEDLHALVDVGPTAVVSIHASEAGITRHVRERLFEPYFAKLVGYHGPPLGPAVAFGTIRQAGGQLTAVSDGCEGPLFRVYLPVVGA